jgi:hypothetical protein
MKDRSGVARMFHVPQSAPGRGPKRALSASRLTIPAALRSVS